MPFVTSRSIFFVDRLEALLDQLGIYLADDHPNPGLRRHLRDARPSGHIPQRPPSDSAFFFLRIFVYGVDERQHDVAALLAHFLKSRFRAVYPFGHAVFRVIARLARKISAATALTVKSRRPTGAAP